MGQSTICRDLKAIKIESQKKLKSIVENELPLLLEAKMINNFDLSKYIQNLRTNPQINCSDYTNNGSTFEFLSQNMVGRKGFEPSNPAMSRRYLNQARPPARCTKAVH